MSDKFTISIEAKDGTKQAFDAIGKNAKQAGTAVESANKNAARSFDDFERSATKAGAAVGTALGVLSKLGQASQNQAREIDGLKRAYGDAADGLIEWSDALQENTNFSNEQARQAAMNAATLAQNYDFTAEQIQQLIERTADLAAVQGMDLTDAIQRTQSAMRGEAESAEALGLTLNDSRVAAYALEQGITDYATGLSEAERAQVRFNYFLEQSAYATGAAADAATGIRGVMIEVGHSFQDAAVNIGGMLGPAGEAASVLGDVALAMPLVGAGAGKAAAGLLKVAQSAKVASAASALLTAATGPVGLTIAAVGAGLAIAEATGLINIFGDKASAASVETTVFADSFDALAASVGSNIEQITDIRSVEAMLQSLEDIGVAGDKIRREFEAGQALIVIPPQLQDDMAAIQAAAGDAEAGMRQFYEQVGRGAVSAEQFNAVQTDIAALLSDQTVQLDRLEPALADVFGQWSSGAISGEELVTIIDEMSRNAYEFTAAAEAEATALGSVSEEVRKQAEAYRYLQSIQGARTATPDSDWAKVAEYQAEASEKQAELLEEQAEAAAELASTYRDALVPGVEGLEGALKNAVPAGHDMLDVLVALQEAGQTDVGESFARVFDRIDEVDAMGNSTADLADSWLHVSDAIERVGGRIDGVLGLFSVIDDLGSRMQATAAIANDLFGPDGNAFDGIGPLADLLATGAISYDDFNSAVMSGTIIQREAAEAEGYLNEMRAIQINSLALSSVAYSEYLKTLADMPAAEQAHALAMLDSANQAKVAAAYSTAYSASLDEIPQDVATEIIANSARADPIIAGLLEEFGLIEEGANGEIKVNFPNGDSVVSVTKSLTESINALIETLGGVPPSVALDVTASGVEETATALADVTGIAIAADGQSMRILVEAPGADAASTAIGDTYNHASNLDGMTSTVNVAANESGVMTVLQTIGNEITVLDGKGATVYVGGDAQAAFAAVREADYQVTVLDGKSGTVYVFGDESGATAATGNAAAAVSNVDGSGATVYIYGDDSNLQAVLNNVPQGGVVGTGVVWIEAQGPGIGYTAYQMGGVVGYQMGGVVGAEVAEIPRAQLGRVVMVGEAGRELVELPVGSRVIPNPATEAMLNTWQGEQFADGGWVQPEPSWKASNPYAMMAADLNQLLGAGMIVAAQNAATEFSHTLQDAEGDLQSLGFVQAEDGSWVYAQTFYSGAKAATSFEQGAASVEASATAIESAMGSAVATMTAAVPKLQAGIDYMPLYGKTGIEDKITLPSDWGAQVASLTSLSNPTTTTDAITVNLHNNGTIQGIDDLVSFMAEGLAEAVSGRRRELGMAG